MTSHKHCGHHSRCAALFIVSVGLCIGIALGNALYILLVIIGASALRHFSGLFTAIELLGALYLLWIGSHLVRSRPQILALDETR